jgi:phosphoribosyl-dephospho-CoA transferase
MPAVHSLLHVADIAALVWESDAPDWAVESLRLAPFVVVRRSQPRPDAVPVGVRGHRRSQRAAAWLAAGAVSECVTPQMLTAGGAWRTRALPATPALAVLDQAAAIFDAHGMTGRWGPGGSVGFELLSGVCHTTTASDLDIVLCAEEPMEHSDAACLLADLSNLPVRVDVLLETPNGAVALGEYVGSPALMLLRSANGPRWVRDPWCAHSESSSP